VELVGEILTVFPSKSVTLMDRGTEVCRGFHPSTKAYLTNWLKMKGCELALGEIIKDSDEKKGITLASGKIIKADITYKCYGMKPSTDWLKKSIPLKCFDDRGFLRVNDHLQIEECKNVYAMGDCISHASKGIKLAYTAELQAHVVTSNVKLSCKSLPLLKYPEGAVGSSQVPSIYCISLGKYDASLGFNSLVVNGFLAAIFKWLIEWTKMLANREYPVGVIFWKVGDGMASFLARTLFKTPAL